MNTHVLHHSMTTTDRSPAQIYALVLGAVLLVAGVVGFAIASSFGTGVGIETDKLLFFEVNGWLNLMHMAAGLAGLALMASVSRARLYALAVGIVYLVVGVIGLFDAPIVELLAANDANEVMYFGIAALGIGAGITSPAEGDSA